MTQPDTPARSDSFRPVLGATVLLVFALLAIASLKSNRDLQAARASERMLTEKIAVTRLESERLRVRIDRLRHDPTMLERLAREDLGLVRPGDMIVELPEAPSASSASPSPVPPAAPAPLPTATLPVARPGGDPPASPVLPAAPPV